MDRAEHRALIVRALKKTNVSSLAKKLCFKQLSFGCHVLVQRLTEDQIKNYKRWERKEGTCSSYLRKLELRRELKRLLQKRNVLEKDYKELSSQSTSLYSFVRENNLPAEMVRKWLRSMGNRKEDHNEKTGEINVKCSDVRKPKLKNKMNCDKLEKELLSNVLLKKDSSAFEMDLNKSNSKDSRHQQVSRNMVLTSVAENNESGACLKSSQNPKQTVEKPRELTLVSVKNIPEERVSSGLQSLNKQNCKQAIPSSNDLGKHIYTKSVHEGLKTSYSRRGCAPHKVSYLSKPQEYFSVKSKSDNSIIIRKETKSVPNGFGGDNEKSGGSAADHDSKQHKRAEDSSLDKHKKTTVSGMQSSVEHKIKKSHERTNHHEEHKAKKSDEHTTNHHQDRDNQNCGYKSKRGSSGVSHHSSSSSKPKSSHNVKKSSDSANKPLKIKKMSLHETHKSAEKSSHKSDHASSKECMSSNTVTKHGHKNKHSTRSVHSESEEIRKSDKKKSDDSSRNYNPAEKNKVCVKINGNKLVCKVQIPDRIEISDKGVLINEVRNNLTKILTSGCTSDSKEQEITRPQKEQDTEPSTHTGNEAAIAPSTILEDTSSQDITGSCASEIHFECNNSLNKKRPHGRESLDSSEQVEIKKMRHLLKDTENFCSSESVRQQPKLPVCLPDDEASPDKMSSNQLPNNSAPVQSQNSMTTLILQDPPRVVTNSDPNCRNIQNTLSRSGNIICGTPDVSVQMKIHDSIKQEVRDFKQENTKYTESDIIIIDDDDDDDDDYDSHHIFKKITSSRAVHVGKENKTTRFLGSLAEPEIQVLHSVIGGRIINNNKLSCHENSDVTTRRQNEFNSFNNGDVSLEGIISVKKYDGNEYVIIENSNSENVSVHQFISEKEAAPLKLRNVISYFRDNLKEPKDVMIQDGRIIVAGGYKTFISCLVFLYYNYKYFFHSISNNITQLVQRLNVVLNSIKADEQMKMMARKLDENPLKTDTIIELTESYLNNNIEANAFQFSKIFDQMLQLCKDVRLLSPFYCTVFSLILFQRIVYHVYIANPKNFHEYFLKIRSVIQSLLLRGNGDTYLISLLTEKSDADFVNDYNTVSRGISVIQSAIEFHYTRGNRNQRESNVSIHPPDMSSPSFHDNVSAFPQSPSVTSTQLHPVNNTNQSSLISYNETLNGNNSETTNSDDSFVSHHSMSEIMKKPSISSRPLQRIMSPVNMKSTVIDNEHSKTQQSSTNKAGRVTVKNFHSISDSQGAVNLVMNSQNFGTNMVSESSDTNLQRTFSGSQNSVGQESNGSCWMRSRDDQNDVYFEGALDTQNNPAAWNTQNSKNTFERGLVGGALNSVNQVSRPSTVTTAPYSLNCIPSNEILLNSQNPVWNGSIQSRFGNGLHETGPTSHINYGLCMRRAEIYNNILNSTNYKTAQPQVGTNLDSPFHVVEQHQMSTEPLPDPNDCASNKNNTTTSSDFLHQSPSLLTFRPPTGVPLGNHGMSTQNENSPMQRIRNPTKYGFCNTVDSASHVTEQQQMSAESSSAFRPPTRVPLENSGTSSQNAVSQMPRKQQMDSGTGQSQQRRKPMILPEAPQFYYNDARATLITHAQSQNASDVNNNTPDQQTDSSSDKSRPFQHWKKMYKQ